VFVAGYLLFGAQLLLMARLLFACAMIVLFVIDLQCRILPNIITIPGVLVGFAFSLFLPPGWLDSLIGIMAGGGILLLIAEAYYRVRKEEGLGMGDVKMLAMIGAFLGWKLMLVTLVLSSFMGSIMGLTVIALKKGDMKYALPFGTFLAVGALVSSVVGDAMLNWYLGFY
jgi:leader peptidase (prepilin peptidase)/N-methyltransferase